MTWRAQVWPSILGLLGLSSCEMFFGEFVEGEDVDTTPTGVVTACDKPQRCRGERLETCTRVDGVDHHSLAKTCESSELCNEALPDCMLCAPDTFQCQGFVIQKCNAMGSGWEMTETCVEGATVCDADTGACEACLPGDTKCDITNGEHYRLECQATSEGRMWRSTSCNSFVCSTDAEGSAYCQTCTTVGAKNCADVVNGGVSTAIVECTPELRLVATPCPEGICEEDECRVQ